MTGKTDLSLILILLANSFARYLRAVQTSFDCILDALTHREIIMSLRPQEIPPVPADTIRVAQAAFPRGNT